jgi:hypothetical protein
MEFIKIGKDKYLIKSSNGRLVSEKEKKQLENQELVIESKHCEECEIKTIVVDKEDLPKVEGVFFNEEITPKAIVKPIKKKTKKTATSTKENADDTIQETDIVI